MASLKQYRKIGAIDFSNGVCRLKGSQLNSLPKDFIISHRQFVRNIKYSKPGNIPHKPMKILSIRKDLMKQERNCISF